MILQEDLKIVINKQNDAYSLYGKLLVPEYRTKIFQFKTSENKEIGEGRNIKFRRFTKMPSVTIKQEKATFYIIDSTLKSMIYIKRAKILNKNMYYWYFCTQLHNANRDNFRLKKRKISYQEALDILNEFKIEKVYTVNGGIL